MVGSYAYSFDRENFCGGFASRTLALRAALEHLAHAPESSADSIFIGKRVALEDGTDGFGEIVLEQLRRRVLEHGSDASVESLKRINEHQLADLDDALAAALQGWLKRHGITPTQSKVSAISEHATGALLTQQL